MVLAKIRSFGVVVLAFVAAFAPALAGDWSITGDVSETVKFNDNPSLLLSNPGWVTSPTETLSSDFGYTMKDGRFDLLGSFTARNFFGPGTKVTNDQYLPRVEAKFEKFGPRTALNLSASYAVERTAFNDAFLVANCTPILGTVLFDCDGEIVDPTSTAIRQTLNTAFSLNQKLDARNSLLWSNAFSDKIFTTGAAADFQTMASSLAWNTKLTKRIDANLKFGVDWLGVNDVTALDRFVYGLSARVTDRLTDRLTVHAVVSGKLTDTFKNDIAAPGVPRTFSALKGATFKAGGEYLASPFTTISFEGVIGTDEQPNAQWFNHYSATIGLVNKIDDLSNFGITSSLSYNELLLAPDGRRAVVNFSLSPSYSLQLARDWNMLATYRLAVINSTSGAAVSNEVGVSFSHHFVAMP